MLYFYGRNFTGGHRFMIRKAEEKDLDAIALIYDKIISAEEAGKVTIGWQRGVYPTRDTAKSALSRGDLFVFEKDGAVYASAVINQIQVPEYVNCPWQYHAPDNEIMVLHTLTVDPDAGRHGIGRKFVSFYEDFARGHGCRYLRMDTNEKNTNARSLYSKLGYSEPGKISCVFNGIPGVTLVCLEKKI